MTQAFNLSQFANKLNSSGATDNTGLQNSAVTVTAGTGLSGGGSVSLGGSTTLNISTVPIANGGTGQTTAANAINALLPTQTGNSGKFLTTNGTVSSWGTAGGVTSVATGNGLSGGTITTTGTLVVACPTALSIGSYASPSCSVSVTVGNITDGSNMAVFTQANPDFGSGQTVLTGTWRYMGGQGSLSYSAGPYGAYGGLFCRVS